MKNINLKLGKLYVISGLPGSGKTSLLKHVPADMIVSSDYYRKVLAGSKISIDQFGMYESLSEESNNAVFKIINTIIEEKCRLGLTCFVDATNLTDSDRNQYIKIAKQYGMDYEVLIIDKTAEECKINNKNREKRVPEYVIDKMDLEFERTSEFPYQLITEEVEINFIENRIEEDHIDIIGDIHGLKDYLDSLLIKLGYTFNDSTISHPENRKLLFMGDFIDRGPDSIEVLEFVKMAVDNGHYALLGNHEQKLIMSYKQAQANMEINGGIAGKITLSEFMKLSEKKRNSLINFLKSLPFYFVHMPSKTLFVHANISYANLLNLTKSEAIYGSVRRAERAVKGSEPKDTDKMYQELFDLGINEYSLIRGHIPQISEQKNVLSLEEEQAFEGFLVAGRFNNHSVEEIVKVKSDFNFEEYIKDNKLIGFENLITDKLATKQMDSTGNLAIYKYHKKVFFNALWGKNDLLLKSRGLVLDLAGNVIQHPFDKIFNYGEPYKDMKTGFDIPDSEEVIAVEKYNGFLGNIGLNPFTKKLLFTTTGSFNSDFVGYIQDFVDSKLTGKLLKFLNKNPMTLSFEVIHPEDPHIIKYNDQEMGLVLIGARGLNFNDISKTENELDLIAEELGFMRPKWFEIPFGELKNIVENSELEGFIVRRKCPLQIPLLKFKTPYYLITKLLGRMVDSKIKFMFGSPNKFKETIDEEFYELVDLITSRFTLDYFLSISNEEKIPLVRDLIKELRA